MNSQNLGQLHQVVLFILVLDIYKIQIWTGLLKWLQDDIWFFFFLNDL